MPKSTVQTVYLKDIGELVAKTLQLTKQDAATYTETVINTIAEELLKGHKVNLHSLAIFNVKEIKERTYKNPKNGEPVQKPAYRKLTVKGTKPFNTRLN
jgi:nucleoid DNA-binding protein